ncbi:MAG: hypothetical protein JW798_03655 [Prolixibacteraceae bacterium]|nr:hypothetical protein [Prolixibacteraceae bacterium]
MKTIFRVWSLIVFIFISFTGFGQKVSKLWETEAVFSGPESVVYDPVRELLYVSNYAKKHEGCTYGTEFISKMDLS